MARLCFCFQRSPKAVYLLVVLAANTPHRGAPLFLLDTPVTVGYSWPAIMFRRAMTNGAAGPLEKHGAGRRKFESAPARAMRRLRIEGGAILWT